VILSVFLDEVKKYGLLYPPDPTEKDCFIGGTAATNASGEKTFKYGPTRDYIIALEVVLPDGEMLELKRGEVLAVKNKLKLETCTGKIIKITLPEVNMPPVKNASGYFIKNNMDAIDLFIGSEGTLGVITKIGLRLLVQPEKVISCVIFFNTEQDALSYIKKSRNLSFNTRARNLPDSIDALALEFFDENALLFLRDAYPQIPSGAKAGVWFEQVVNTSNEDVILEEWMKLISEFNGNEDSAWFAFSEADKIKIQEFRHAISAKVNEYISKNNFRKLGTDVAVPDNEFEELYYFSKKLVHDNNIHSVIYGHFGNSHMHLNMLPRTNEEFLTGQELYLQICRKAIELGGTISAEHGVGKLKTKYLLEMYGYDTITKMIKLKKTFDPNMIMGIGNMFPL
ncbi:MAG: FAD-binding oxidoreductase, partial [Ignavibacteriaceae bacterium]